MLPQLIALDMDGTLLDGNGQLPPDFSAISTRARQLAANGARCTDTGERTWNRWVVRCTANGRDLGAVLVREGLARSEPEFGDPYATEQRAARRERRGVWR